MLSLFVSSANAVVGAASIVASTMSLRTRRACFLASIPHSVNHLPGAVGHPPKQVGVCEPVSRWVLQRCLCGQINSNAVVDGLLVHHSPVADEVPHLVEHALVVD